MKAKTFIAYYEDAAKAKRVMHELFDLGVQRDAMSLIEHQMPDELLIEPAMTLPDEERQHYDDKLKDGGAVIVAWVMGPWVRQAHGLLENSRPQELKRMRGRRFVGLYTRT